MRRVKNKKIGQITHIADLKQIPFSEVVSAGHARGPLALLYHFSGNRTDHFSVIACYSHLKKNKIVKK